MASRAPQPDTTTSASGKLQTYGYHNTFSTHASTLPETNPPSYERAVSSRNAGLSSLGSEVLPGYSCGVHLEGFLDIRTEMSSPWLISLDNDWHTGYVVLHGTQLSIYRLKHSFFRTRAPKQGRLIRSFSLQHAEVGIAADWLKGELIPRTTFAKVLPRHAQEKLYETDPELFEPMREWVFRLRVETEQLVFCASSHSEMLDWVEELCQAIDISQPLDDRSDPRYRSLPRRTRRQRQIELTAQMGNQNITREIIEQQFIQEQERIFRRMYPNLAASSSNDRVTPQAEGERDTGNGDNDNEEFDREDAREEIAQSPDALGEQLQRQSSRAEERDTEDYDPKTARQRPPLSENGLCRFRRRCAPILLATSPRASPIIFHDGGRYYIDSRRCRLVPFEIRPPRYESHAVKAPANANVTFANQLLKSLDDNAASTLRPGLLRGISEATTASNWSQEEEAEGEEAGSLHSAVSRYGSSSEDLDRIDTIAPTNESPDAGKCKGKAVVLVAAVKQPPRHMKAPIDENAARRDASMAAAYGPFIV